MSTAAEVDNRLAEIVKLVKNELDYDMTDTDKQCYRRFTLKQVKKGISFIKATTYQIQNIMKLMYKAIQYNWSYTKNKSKAISREIKNQIEKGKEYLGQKKQQYQQRSKNKFMNFPQTPYNWAEIEQMEMERTIKRIKDAGIISQVGYEDTCRMNT